jgi:predicted phosphodiesterase
LLQREGPVLVFGGPYSNRQATEALLAEAARRGIPAANMICTGDVVAYAADPLACCDLIRESGMTVVMGNCEEALGAGAEDCGCGFEEGSACAALSVQWYAYALSRMDQASCRWMDGLPRRVDLRIGGVRLAVIHGGNRDIARFIFGSDEDAIREELGIAGVDGVIAGHCGLPFTREAGGRLWHNPGVIGMPAHDGTPRVWYSVLTPGAGGLAIEHAALAYDHAAAAARMRAEGLPEGYASCLETGIWPSEDVLPPAERAARGQPLAERITLWRWPEGRAARPPAFAA